MTCCLQTLIGGFGSLCDYSSAPEEHWQGPPVPAGCCGECIRLCHCRYIPGSTMLSMGFWLWSRLMLAVNISTCPPSPTSTREGRSGTGAAVQCMGSFMCRAKLSQKANPPNGQPASKRWSKCRRQAAERGAAPQIQPSAALASCCTPARELGFAIPAHQLRASPGMPSGLKVFM